MRLPTLRTAAGVAAVLAACAAQSAMAANVSISVNQPGVYGRVDIGAPVPQAAWVSPQPVVIRPAPVAVQRQPIYLYVPPAHYGNWGRYCDRYNACAQPVVFVRDGWVRERHAQAYGRRDLDRDGVPNRYDRDRDGDGVRNRNDRDRDNDGIRNSRDRRPNNPNWR